MTVLSESVISAPVDATKQASDSESMRNHDRFSHRLFCEVLGVEGAMKCYDNYMDWVYTGNPIEWPLLDAKVSVRHVKQMQVPCSMLFQVR